MNDVDKIFAEAFELFQKKNFSESLRRLSDAETLYLTQFTNDSKISIENLKGFNYLGLNLIEDAQYCFEGALILDEKSSQACAGLGEVFYLKHEEVKAKVMYEYSLFYNPDNQFGQKGLQKVNYILGLPTDHNNLIDSDPVEVPVENDYKIAAAAAGELFSNSKFQEAVESISSFEEKIEIDMNELADLLTELSNMKGMALLNLENLEEAQLSFEKALNTTPDSSFACWGLAEIFFRKRMYEEARTMFEWAVKNDPENSAAKEGLNKSVNAITNLDSGNPAKKSGLKLASGKAMEIE